MKKLIPITIILLLHSFPSFGSPKGKGLICNWSDTELVKKDRKDKRVKVYYFEGIDSVKHFKFIERKTNIEISETLSKSTYNVDYIRWYQIVSIYNISQYNKGDSLEDFKPN